MDMWTTLKKHCPHAHSQSNSSNTQDTCRIQSQLGAAHDDTRTNEIGEGRELGANQVLDFDPSPFVPDEEVLIGCKRLDALGKSLDDREP
jgi:hypothetical protein